MRSHVTQLAQLFESAAYRRRQRTEGVTHSNGRLARCESEQSKSSLQVDVHRDSRWLGQSHFFSAKTCRDRETRAFLLFAC